MNLHGKNETLNKKKLSHIKILEIDKDFVKCYCEIHKNNFEIKWANLIRSKGCSECCSESYRKSRIKPYEKLIEQFKKVHNNFYRYYIKKDVGSFEKIKISCPIHGDFIQQVYVHLNGSGCQKCKSESISNKNSYKDSDWLEKFKSLHNNFYEYNSFKQDENGKIEIICPTHGAFKQSPVTHNQGHGCPKCATEKNTILQLKTHEDVIKDFHTKHKNFYDYSEVDYRGAKEKVTIKCPLHGYFQQTPNDHLSGYGCPKCYVKKSKKEEELNNFILSFNIKTKTSDRTILNGKEIDIFIPSYNVGIEFNGIFWHSHLDTNYRNYHLDKLKLAESKGIELIQINEDEWDNTKQIVKSMLIHKLNKTNKKIHGRKCILKEICNSQYNAFCNENHLQGIRKSSIRIGAFYNNQLVSVIGFIKHKKYDYELARFCVKNYLHINGIAGKLFKYFIKTYKPNNIISFCDRRYSTGNLYYNLGFELKETTKPNYKYFKNGILYSRLKFQKHMLDKKLEVFDTKLSETENMFKNGYKIMFDCGNYKFIWEKSQNL